MYLVFSCSFNPKSRSRLLAQKAVKELTGKGVQAELVDMREWKLPWCDGTDSFSHERVAQLKEKVLAAHAILIAVPIYNYDVNAVARGLVELTGSAWEGKLVGFISAAGGKGSYMAPVGLANSLLLHYHCVIVPRLVYATEEQVTPDEIIDPQLATRIAEQADMLIDLGARLR
jgi:NAD(P)H-dependent FMN reductase